VLRKNRFIIVSSLPCRWSWWRRQTRRWRTGCQWRQRFRWCRRRPWEQGHDLECKVTDVWKMQRLGIIRRGVVSRDIIGQWRVIHHCCELDYLSRQPQPPKFIYQPQSSGICAAMHCGCRGPPDNTPKFLSVSQAYSNTVVIDRNPCGALKAFYFYRKSHFILFCKIQRKASRA